jgi:hypothetical protein
MVESHLSRNVNIVMSLGLRKTCIAVEGQLAACRLVGDVGPSSEGGQKLPRSWMGKDYRDVKNLEFPSLT